MILGPGQAGLIEGARLQTLIDIAIEGECRLDAVLAGGIEGLKPGVVQRGKGVGNLHQPLQIRLAQFARHPIQFRDIILQFRRGQGRPRRTLERQALGRR
jgi:hypothetical protein